MSSRMRRWCLREMSGSSRTLGIYFHSMIFRLARWAIGVAILQGLVLLLLAGVLPGFTVANLGVALLTALLITVVEAIAWPFLYELSVRVKPVLFPVLSFALAGLLVVLLTDV